MANTLVNQTVTSKYANTSATDRGTKDSYKQWSNVKGFIFNNSLCST